MYNQAHGVSQLDSTLYPPIYSTILLYQTCSIGSDTKLRVEFYNRIILFHLRVLYDVITSYLPQFDVKSILPPSGPPKICQSAHNISSPPPSTTYMPPLECSKVCVFQSGGGYHTCGYKFCGGNYWASIPAYWWNAYWYQMYPYSFLM